jgi:hypothetical protein
MDARRKDKRKGQTWRVEKQGRTTRGGSHRGREKGKYGGGGTEGISDRGKIQLRETDVGDKSE